MDSTYQGPISLMLLREYGSAGLANWLVDQDLPVLQNYGPGLFLFRDSIYDLYEATKEKMSREHQQLLQFLSRSVRCFTPLRMFIIIRFDPGFMSGSQNCN